MQKKRSQQNLFCYKGSINFIKPLTEAVIPVENKYQCLYLAFQRTSQRVKKSNKDIPNNNRPIFVLSN